MERVVKKIIRKEFLWAVAGGAVVAVFLLAVKPGLGFKVDWNKFQLGKGPSTLSIDAPSEVAGVGRRFTVKINVDTHNYLINAVQSYVKYDPRVLEVVKTDTSSSFCKFYPENNYSNAKGLVRLVCGTPYPGFKGKGAIQEIQFTAKSFTATKISLEKESKVLASDGKGTNLLKELDEKTITVKAAF